MKEALKNMKFFDDFVKGSDFEKKLDAFLEQAMSQGKLPEDILKEAMKDYHRDDDPFQTEEAMTKGVEFDPSNLKIDPNLFKSFEEMI